jgi:hypothetical protein
MGQMVFVPLSRTEARAWREAGVLPSDDRIAHAATASLVQAHDYDASTAEDADYAALVYAGVTDLTSASHTDPLRLVIAVELGPGQPPLESDDPYGQVSVRDLRWNDARALFADEPMAAEAVTRARQAARGRRLADALDLPEVETLLADHDLLWFAPEELDSLP